MKTLSLLLLGACAPAPTVDSTPPPANATPAASTGPTKPAAVPVIAIAREDFVTAVVNAACPLVGACCAQTDGQHDAGACAEELAYLKDPGDAYAYDADAAQRCVDASKKAFGACTINVGENALGICDKVFTKGLPPGSDCTSDDGCTGTCALSGPSGGTGYCVLRIGDLPDGAACDLHAQPTPAEPTVHYCAGIASCTNNICTSGVLLANGASCTGYGCLGTCSPVTHTCRDRTAVDDTGMCAP